MDTPHPLAGLWLPSNLKRIRSLVRDVAIAAAAVADPFTGDPEMGERFIRLAPQLDAALQPFSEHDLDRPERWPSTADPKLILLFDDLSRSLKDLLRPSTTDMVRYYADLQRELRPSLNELRKVAEKTAGLIQAHVIAEMGPVWDRRRRVLRFGTTVCLKLLDREAPRIVAILDAFEELGWPHQIKSPFEKKKETQDATQELKKKLRPDSPLEFKGDGTAGGIVWVLRERTELPETP